MKLLESLSKTTPKFYGIQRRCLHLPVKPKAGECCGKYEDRNIQQIALENLRGGDRFSRSAAAESVLYAIYSATVVV